MAGFTSTSGKTWPAITLVMSAAAFALGYGLRPLPKAAAEDSAPASIRRERLELREPRSESPRGRGERPSSKPENLPTGIAKAPFEPGKSREWFLLQIKRSGWKDDPTTLFRMVQQYAAMDEAAVAETMTTLRQLVDERQSGEVPESAAIPKEWLGRFGLFPAAMRYAQLNPEALLDAVEKDPALQVQEIYQAALANLAAQDPEQALERVKGLQGDDLRNGMEPILGTLFATDPDRVIRILEDFPQPEFDGERRKVAERLAAEDPQRAIDYAVATIQSGHNPDVLQAAVKTWMKTDQESANRWISTYAGPGAAELRQAIQR